jgi:hypothetical protein
MMDDRKAFNFYRSYYDIALQLDDEDRYQFLMALLEMQFTGKSRGLTGMAQFAFVSQKHSIEAQINGYIFKTTKGPHGGGVKGPSVQEEEKGQEKGEEKGKGGANIVVFGKKTDKFFTVNSKYLSDPKYKVHHDGFKEFSNTTLMGTWFKKDFLIDMFWDQWNGKMFNDLGHLNTVMVKINNNKNG